MFPTDFSELQQVHNPNQQSLAATDLLSEQGFEVHYGLTQEYAKAIIDMAHETSIKEFCPNDSGKRFKDIEAVKNWLSKGRAAFLLMRRSESGGLQLVGYGWVGASTSDKVPGGEATFAIRIGEAGQGKGLATPFAKLIVDASSVVYDAKNLWLETWASNGGAVHVYHKIGFVDVANEQDQRPAADGKLIDDTRLYMSLDNSLLPPKA